MYRRYHRRSRNLVFVIFRTFLSLVIFSVLIVGGYSAFKQFSDFDLVKIDFQKDLPKIAATILAELPIQLPHGGDVGGLEAQKKEYLNKNSSKPPPKAPLSFKFLIVADSHNDNQNLKKALTESGASFVVGLGDYTDIGTTSELKAAKQIFDEATLRYFTTAGDHDLWDSRDKGKEPTVNFSQILGPTYQSFSYKKARFLLIYNSDNYLGVADEQFDWLSSELDRIKSESDSNLILAFVHEPLYHPSSDRMMGKVTPKLRDQAKKLIGILKEAGVKEIFAGDVHYFTRYSEPESGMPMTTVGALTSVRNTQSPRYAVVSVYGDGNYGVEDVEVK